MFKFLHQVRQTNEIVLLIFRNEELSRNFCLNAVLNDQGNYVFDTDCISHNSSFNNTLISEIEEFNKYGTLTDMVQILLEEFDPESCKNLELLSTSKLQQFKVESLGYTKILNVYEHLHDSLQDARHAFYQSHYEDVEEGNPLDSIVGQFNIVVVHEGNNVNSKVIGFFSEFKEVPNQALFACPMWSAGYAKKLFLRDYEPSFITKLVNSTKAHLYNKVHIKDGKFLDVSTDQPLAHYIAHKNQRAFNVLERNYHKRN